MTRPPKYGERTTWTEPASAATTYRVEIPDGDRHYVITVSWSEAAVAANEYTATEPAAARAIEESFTLTDNRGEGTSLIGGWRASANTRPMPRAPWRRRKYSRF